MEMSCGVVHAYHDEYCSKVCELSGRTGDDVNRGTEGSGFDGEEEEGRATQFTIRKRLRAAEEGSECNGEGAQEPDEVVSVGMGRGWAVYGCQ